MCIGLPMRVVGPATDGRFALCRARSGAEETLDLALVGPQPEGTWVLAFTGAARAVLTDEDAMRTADALDALEVAMRGGSVDHLFADLIDREPQLPEHLRTPKGLRTKARVESKSRADGLVCDDEFALKRIG